MVFNLLGIFFFPINVKMACWRNSEELSFAKFFSTTKDIFIARIVWFCPMGFSRGEVPPGKHLRIQTQ